MWSHEYQLDTELDPQVLWGVLADVPGWARWNDGVERIEVDGPPALGTVFRMTTPGEDTLTSDIVEFVPGRILTDRTVLGEVEVRVRHEIRTVGTGAQVAYTIEVDGVPDETAAQIGEGVSADFPDVLAALVRYAAEHR